MRYRLAMAILLACAFGVRAEEAKPTEQQIQQWVAQLGDIEFDVRQKAEAALIKTGEPAIAAVSQVLKSPDAEVNTRAKRILDELGWAIKPDYTDILKLFPSETMFLLYTPGLKQAAEALRTTPVGKLYDNPETAKVRNTLGESLAQNMGMDEAAQKRVLTWLERYGGPYCVSFVKIDSSKQYPERMQEITLMGISDREQAKAYAEYSDAIPLGWGDNKVEKERYKGIDFYFPAQWAYTARTRIKNLIVHTNCPANMKAAIDRFADAPKASLTEAADFTAGRQKNGAGALAELFFSMTELRKNEQFPGNAGQVIGALGLEELKYAFVSLFVKDGLITEKAFCKLEGQRKGLAKFLSFPPAAAQFAYGKDCPQDAFAFLSVTVNAREFYDAALSVVTAGDANEAQRFKDAVAGLEKNIGIKLIEDVLPAVKGEVAVWVEKPPAGALKPPDFGAVVQTVDAAGAAAVSDALAKLFPAATDDKELVASADYKGHKIWWLKKEKLADMPYAPAWSADGARVLLGSSTEVVQRTLARAETKTPGIDQTEDFKRLLQLIPPPARGGILYINTPAAATWGYTVGLPLLALEMPEELRPRFAALPQDAKGLFAGITGTLLSITGTDDGVQAVSAGSVPAAAFIMGGPVTFIQLEMRMMRQRH